MKRLHGITLSAFLPCANRLENRKGGSSGFKENSHSHIPPP